MVDKGSFLKHALERKLRFGGVPASLFASVTRETESAALPEIGI